MAVDSRQTSLVRLLLAFGVDPKGPIYSLQPKVRNRSKSNKNPYQIDSRNDKAFFSVLEVAATTGDCTVLQMLLHAATWTREEIGRALTKCIISQTNHLVPMLLQAGADLGQEISVPVPLNWFTPLKLAIQRHDLPLTRTLIAAGCDLNQRCQGNSEGTPLQYAVISGNAEIIQLLLEAGADVNSPPAPWGGATALQFAAINGYIRICCQLIDAGANINAPGAEHHGRTALEGAAENGRIDVLAILLDKGAIFEGSHRRQFVRAVKLAETRGHSAIAKFLKSNYGWNDLDSEQYAGEILEDSSLDG